MMMIRKFGCLLLALTLGACTSNCGGLQAPGGAGAAGTAPAVGVEKGLISCVNEGRLMAHVERLVALGPRPAGSGALQKSRDYIIGQLREAGLAPSVDRFWAQTPHPVLSKVEMANIEVPIKGTGPGLVVLTGHYDTKLIDGIDFLGANDGGSSTAVLLELGRCLVRFKKRPTVRLVFFDGEEALVKWSDTDSLYGSKRYAARLAQRGERKKVSALINIDMVGDRNLSLFKETNSTPWVLQTVVDGAATLGDTTLFNGPRGAIGDDHLPFVEMGMNAANLIDLQYGPGFSSNEYWHTHNDTLEHVSGKSMGRVARAVLVALPIIGSHKNK